MTHKQINPYQKNIIIVGSIIGFVLLGIIGAWYGSTTGMKKVVSMQEETETYVQNHSSDLQIIVTDIFDEARDCLDQKCRDNVSQEIFVNLPSFEELENRESTYFVRMRDENTLEKLYLSGQYAVNYVDTDGEKEVKELLNGKKENLNQGKTRWFNTPAPDMIYLEDLPSEFETIVPIQENETVQGAMVRLYGD